MEAVAPDFKRETDKVMSIPGRTASLVTSLRHPVVKETVEKAN